MKQNLRILMVFLMVLLFGGASFGQTTETYKFSSFTQPSSSITLKGQYCSITLTKGANTAPQWNKNSKEARVYGGGSLVVASELKITKIVYTFNDNKGTFGSVTPNGYDKTTKTWSSTEGSNSITFKMGGKSGNYGFTQLEITYAASNKKETTLSFGETYDNQTITKKVNGSYTAKASLKATESGEAIDGATITYESSDKEIADVEDGEVLCYKEGTAVITAKYAGDDTYQSSSVSYTLKVEDGRTPVTLSFSQDKYTFDQGSGDKDFTNAATIEPKEAGEVTYSSDKDWALVDKDGSIVLSTDNVGTATITATFAGNDTYKPATASYTITVKKVVEDGVFDFTGDGTEDYGSGLKPTKDTQAPMVTTSKWQAGQIGMETSGNIRWWINGSTNELRFYDGSSFMLSAPMGYVITSVELTGAYAFNASLGNYNANSGKWNGAENTIKFSYNAKKGNIAVKSITVKYVKAESLTTAASGFATYAADFAVDYKTAGLEAYAVKVNADNSGVEYTECTGVVPAGKAVLVKGTPSTEYTLTPATEEAGEFDTDLKASDGNVTITADNHDKIYAFGTNNGKSGFKHVKVGATIAAKKGYLELNDATNAKDFFAFDNSITGIDNATIDIPEEEVPLFNLAGQRVAANYKGIVIKNGKKFVNK